MARQPKGNFLQWLETFIHASNCGSIHRAAALCCISPSAVSLHIKKLEEDLGFRLFDRTSRGLELTHQGRQFQSVSVAIFEKIGNLRTHQSLRPVLRGAIRLSSLNRLAHHFIPAIIQFKKMHPEVNFAIQLGNGDRVWRNLEEGSCDLAFIIHRRLPGHLQFISLRPSSAFLYTPPGNPYQLPAVPSWDQICELPFISLTLEGYVNPVINLLPEIRHPNNVVLAIDDFMLAMKLVKTGLGVCIAPPLTPLESASDFTVFNIDHIFPIGSFGIGIRKKGLLAPQSKAFMEFVIDRYDSAGADKKEAESWVSLQKMREVMKSLSPKPQTKISSKRRH
jgi:DNA-binding transcriptional LysR family regulator